MTPSARLTLAGAALAAALACPLRASAQSPTRIETEIAGDHFAAGRRYFQLGRFDEAAQEFQRAYDLTHQRDLLFNLGRSHENAGHLPPAIEAYQRYVDSTPVPPDAAEVRAHLAELRARSPAPAPSPSPAPVATTPAATAPAPVPPPLHTRVVHEQPALNAVGPWIALGVGVVLVGLGVWQGLAANDHASAVNAANSGQVPWSLQVDQAYHAVRGEVPAAYGLTIAGGALALGGVLWLALRGPGERREVVVTPTAMATPGGLVLGLGGAL